VRRMGGLDPDGGRSGSTVGTPLRVETVLFLAGIALLLVFLALEPFLSYALFGSDTGEYYRLTADLVTTGSIPHGSAYLGWGSAYPDFPGIYVLGGGAAEALHLSVFTGLTVVVPVVAVLSVLPLFLLLRRLYPNDTVALLSAAIASVAMPRLFSIAHPAPLALGDFLSVACLWMLVEGRSDRRWYVPLSLTSGALIVTHHLSSYFFAIGALGGIVFLELWRPGLWSRRFPLREFVFLGAFLTATFGFWFYGTYDFVSKVLLPGFGGRAYVGFGALELAGLAAIALLAGLVRWRRSRHRRRRGWVRLPTERSTLRDAIAIAVGVGVGVSLLLVVPIPGTSQTTSPTALLWFAPILALGIFCAGSRRSLSPARTGPFGLTWLGALGLSTVAMLGLAALGTTFPQYSVAVGFADTLSPGRHVEYLFLPLGLLMAVGMARVVTRAGDRWGGRAMVAASLAVVVVVAANAAIVYPPQSDFGGFEEGLTRGDAALWMWVGIAIPTNQTVASDHRLSSMLFGFDGNAATWVTTPGLFVSSNWTQAYTELRSVGVPNPAYPHAIDFVAVDGVMRTGVALDPSALALPLSHDAIVWFEGPPFIPVYENGLEVVYLVDSTLLRP